MASTRYDSFWTRRYRTRLYFHDRLKLIDFVDVLLIGIAGTISAFGKPWTVFILLGIYLVVTAGKFTYTMRNREPTNYLKNTVFRLLGFINEELFKDSNSTRFTIFRIAPYRSSHIIPWIRFKRGGRGLKEAFESTARFTHGEGITGKVWEKPPGKLAIQIIPEVPGNDLNLLRLLYRHTYGVKADTVEAISEYMTQVRCIISYVCLDENKQFLNLLSLDIAADVRRVPATDPDTISLEFNDNGRKVHVDTQSLWRLVTTIGTVLRSSQTSTKEGAR